MMQWEEYRSRESSREHYEKSGLVIHGGLFKYRMNNRCIFKRIYYISPEGNGTQDTKAAIAFVYVIVCAIKKEKYLKDVHNIIILSDNV